MIKIGDTVKYNLSNTNSKVLEINGVMAKITSLYHEYEYVYVSDLKLIN